MNAVLSCEGVNVIIFKRLLVKVLISTMLVCVEGGNVSFVKLFKVDVIHFLFDVVIFNQYSPIDTILVGK